MVLFIKIVGIEEENITYHLGFIFSGKLYNEEELTENVSLQLEQFTNLK